MSQDALHRFIFEGSAVRGELVRLRDPWREMLERRTYPAEIRVVLGEALAAVSLLSARLKSKGSLTLQTKGDGPLSMLVVESTGRRTVRGLAHWRGETGDREFGELMGEGHLAMTFDPGEGKERYQGIVALGGDSLADCVQRYFDASEQLPTRLWLAVGRDEVAGLMLQNMPGDERFLDADAWNRTVTLAETVEREELLQLPPHEVLHRLFHEETVRVFSPENISFECSCTRERAANVLRLLGPEELRETIREEGLIEANCEFCKQNYRFDEIDMQQLFATGDASEADGTLH